MAKNTNKTKEMLEPILGEELLSSPPPKLADRVLRRVRVSPETIDYFLLQIAPYAAEFGCTGSERERVAVFFRDEDILLASDLDQGHTSTVDGRKRPFRFRARIPIEGLDEEHPVVRRVGVWLSYREFIEGLRNRVENSQNFGILDVPVTVEVLATEDRTSPAAVMIIPDGGMRPRKISVLDGASLAQFDEVEPEIAERGIPGIEGEALVELGNFADETVGVCLSVGHEGSPTYTYSVGPKGVMVGRAPGVSGGELGALGQDVEAAKALQGEVVLSSRFAMAVGFSQQVLESLYRKRHVAEMNRYAAHAMGAALAASLVASQTDDGNQVLQALQVELGRKAVEQALSGSKGNGDEERAVLNAESLLNAVPESQHAALVQEAAKQFADNTTEISRGTIRRLADGDASLEAMSRVVLAVEANPADRNRLAMLVGDIKLREAARTMVSGLAGTQAVEKLRFTDLGLAAVQLRGRYSETLTNLVLPMVPLDKADIWWERFEGYLAELKLPHEIREYLLEKKRLGRVPKTKDLAFSHKKKTNWLKVAQHPAQGMFWKNKEGRVYYGAGDDELGVVMLSDIAVQPDASQYPLRRSEVEAMINRRMALNWKGALWSADLEWAVGRTGGIVDADAARTPVKDGEPPRALFLARWVPADSTDLGTEAILSQFQDVDRTRPETPETVYIDDEGRKREFRKERNPNTPAAPEAVAGTLRIFPLSIWGEELHLEIPMQAAPAVAENKPFAFALDAEQLQLMVTFATRKGRQVLLEASEGMARIADRQSSRVVLMPTVGRTQVPEMFRAHVAAAGVPEQGRKIALSEVIARAAMAERQRKAELQEIASGEGARDHVESLGSGIVWAPRATSVRPSKKGEVEEIGMLVDSGLLTPSGAIRIIDRQLEEIEKGLDQSDLRSPQYTIDIFGEMEAILPASRTTGRPVGVPTVRNQLVALRKKRDKLLELRSRFVSIEEGVVTTESMREGLDRYDPLLRSAEAEVEAELGDLAVRGAGVFLREEDLDMRLDRPGRRSPRG